VLPDWRMSPVMAARPPSGADWVHEIKHDGYRMIVRRDGPSVRLYRRNAYDWTARLVGSQLLPSRSRPRASRSTARRLCSGLRAEHEGEDLGNLPFLDRKAALARLLRNTEAGILLNEHIAENGPTIFAHACQLGAEGIVSKKVDGTYRSGPCRVWAKVRNPAASPCSGSAARIGIGDPGTRSTEVTPKPNLARRSYP
jgi:bifunctional non-homologous end joining protein LigD